jgi:hypothetical protein
MMQVRPIFVREAALLLAELAEKAAAGDGFARALEGREAEALDGDGWRRGPAAFRRAPPDRTAGFAVHSFMESGPERPLAPLGLLAYAARLAERVVIEGPVPNLRLSV